MGLPTTTNTSMTTRTPTAAAVAVPTTTLTRVPTSAPTAVPTTGGGSVPGSEAPASVGANFTLVRQGAECHTGDDTKLGTFDGVQQCADACEAVGWCEHFIFGFGSKEGQVRGDARAARVHFSGCAVTHL